MSVNTMSKLKVFSFLFRSLEDFNLRETIFFSIGRSAFFFCPGDGSVYQAIQGAFTRRQHSVNLANNSH